MLDLRSAWMAWVLLLSLWLPLAQGMKDNQIKELRYFPPPSLFYIPSSQVIPVCLYCVQELTTRGGGLDKKQNTCSTMASTII